MFIFLKSGERPGVDTWTAGHAERDAAVTLLYVPTAELPQKAGRAETLVAGTTLIYDNVTTQAKAPVAKKQRSDEEQHLQQHLTRDCNAATPAVSPCLQLQQRLNHGLRRGSSHIHQPLSLIHI